MLWQWAALESVDEASRFPLERFRDAWDDHRGLRSTQEDPRHLLEEAVGLDATWRLAFEALPSFHPCQPEGISFAAVAVVSQQEACPWEGQPVVASSWVHWVEFVENFGA